MPTRPKQPCPKCRKLHCSHPRQKQRDTNPVYRDPEYRRTRDRILKDWRKQHGNLCPGAEDLDHPPHQAKRLTIDHILPVSLGGTHDPANLRVLCAWANSRRGNGTTRKD